MLRQSALRLKCAPTTDSGDNEKWQYFTLTIEHLSWYKAS